MKQSKFLTVFAVFDSETQIRLKNLQDKILELGYEGSQTMDIPFHISLGSFPVESAEDLTNKIKSVCAQTKEFEIHLQNVNHFNNSVLFVEPDESTELRALHNLFDNNFADGFPWHAHATLFCGESNQVVKAIEIAESAFQPFVARIVGIHMGEFFPTKMLVSENLLT